MFGSQNKKSDLIFTIFNDNRTVVRLMYVETRRQGDWEKKRLEF
jgi:hypothetical protein